MEVGWQVEYDNYCQKVLQARWPNVKGTELEQVDVVCGGFPCFVEGTLIETIEGHRRIDVVDTDETECAISQ